MSGPTATAIPPILKVLEDLQSEGVLAGLLDLQHIVIGGHSAGGRAAVESASSKFYSQVAGALGYGAHTAAVTQLGYQPGTILSLPMIPLWRPWHGSKPMATVGTALLKYSPGGIRPDGQRAI